MKWRFQRVSESNLPVFSIQSIFPPSGSGSSIRPRAPYSS